MNRRVTRPGHALTLDEHMQVAHHLKAIRAHIRAVVKLLSGRAYSHWTDALVRAESHAAINRLRCYLDDELATLPETKTWDNHKFCAVYYGDDDRECSAHR